MATKAIILEGVRTSSGATAIDSPLPLTGAAQCVSAWLTATLAWQTVAWTANLEAMRLTQQALRPDTWAQLGEQWAYMQQNGPIPS